MDDFPILIKEKEEEEEVIVNSWKFVCVLGGLNKFTIEVAHCIIKMRHIR